MKWFQVDADTPNDPRIRSVRRELGAAGVGGLFLLWCHIADHGRKPGWSIDGLGHPMPEAELIDASGLSESDFSKLASNCTATGHWLKRQWDRNRVIAIPAMVRRADTYTKRQLRTDGEQGSNRVRSNFDNKTRQDKTNEVPPNPLKGARLTRRDLKEAREIRNRAFGRCPHEPTCESGDACVRTIALSRKQRGVS